MEIPYISFRNGGLYIRMAEGAGGQDKGGDPQFTSQLAAQNLCNGGISSMADKEGQFFEAMVGQAGAYVIQHVVVGIRL